MKLDREPEEVMSIDMTPMVDCIFAIILFLVATAAIEQSLEQDINISLPSQGRQVQVVAPPSPPVVVNVRYLPGGKAYYHVESNPISLGELTSFLSRKRVANRDQGVVIRGDKNVKWDNIAAVMSCCAQAGISKISATVEVREEATQ